MTTLGLGPFRAALAVEIALNIVSLPSVLFKPDQFLSMLVTGPSQITPGLRTMTQVFGCCAVGLTLSLILSWPEPEPGLKGEAQRGFRRSVYVSMAGLELSIAGVSIYHLLTSNANSGLTDKAMFGTLASMVSVLGLRALFLVWKPEWLEGRGVTSAKTQ